MPELLSYAETRSLIDQLRPKPKLADELIPQQVSMATVQRVLQILLAERVSIRDLPTIPGRRRPKWRPGADRDDDGRTCALAAGAPAQPRGDQPRACCR